MAPEIGPKSLETFEKRAPGSIVVMAVLVHDTAHSLCVSESQYTTADAIVYKNIRNFD